MSNSKQSERRRVENEMMARTENDRVKQATQSLLHQAEEANLPLNFYCECAELDCIEKIPVSVRDFESVHENSAKFIVKSGHEQLDVERVVQEHPDYKVVEKLSGEFVHD